MARKKKGFQYLVCIDNDAYPASLEACKVYRVVPDETAQLHKFVRVIDESGEDYLYPAALFVPIDVPSAARRVFAAV